MSVRKKYGVTTLEAERILKGVTTLFTSEQTAKFHSLGDVNFDGYIDATDLELIKASYGWKGTPGENPADINADGVVDIFDASICGRNQGKDIWSYFGVSKPVSRKGLILILCPFIASTGVVLLLR